MGQVQPGSQVRCSTYVYIYMGQFLQDGNFGGFMSNFFFKQKATVAKPMDFDDFYRFVLINHDLGMVRKSILTLSIQKKHIFWYPEVDPFFKFYSYFNAVAQPNLHCWTGFDFLIIFLVKF